MAREERRQRTAPPRLTNRPAWLVAMTLALAGCQRAATPGRERADTARHETRHAGLRAEIARLEAEQATPLLLQAAQQRADPDGTRARQCREALNQILDPAALQRLADRLAALDPASAFDWNEATWRAAQEVRTAYAPHLARYRELLERDDFRFPSDYLGGFLADLSFLDHASAAHRLEALEVADALRADRPHDALRAARGMFRITAALNRPRLLSARLTAAQLRSEALHVMAAVAGHARADRNLHRQLRDMLNQQLADWPPDADAWIGDRALGMQTYDMVRGGRLLDLLTDEEVETARRGEDRQRWTRRIMQSLDDDEAFYLEAMRALIDSCHEPYAARAPILNEYAARLDRLRDTPRYPFLAAQVLLAHVAPAMRRQAADQARCEAWRLALAAATGDVADPPPINPLTGTPFVLVVSPTQVRVAAIDGRDPGESVSIPVVAAAMRDDGRR